MKRLAITHHTVRCPLEDCAASLAVLSDLGGYPSRRHLNVTACSLRPSPAFVPPVRRRYFADVAPPMSYLDEVDPGPQHPAEVACARHCLAALNAAEPGAAAPPRCTSGVSDGMELARQTQSPAVTRLLWFYGG
jgi:hypothetical protein